MHDLRERIEKAVEHVRQSNPALDDNDVAYAALSIVAFDCGHKAGMLYQNVDMARETFFMEAFKATGGMKL